MDNPFITRIVVQPYTAPRSYSEREAATASHLNMRTLHSLETLGLVQGEGSGKNRRYSEEDVRRLRRIRRLQHELGVNLEGVEVVLYLLRRLAMLQQELEQTRSQVTEIQSSAWQISSD
ncbi:chaperone modulator CbpM [Ktedonobacter racemifer]|uniref:Transcriptional regulator, MerR family n=1 Tax=Ktedonobacter racemifer DSM 44963 TaxID=485913 RepID=D6U237_KTERA|nr:chaperone modulator CbpM [Ktedonobacter racemifer]EFH80921.1 transcriptional regulator, MerR family [Ktedonobacter racemifer DSM 44963]